MGAAKIAAFCCVLFLVFAVYYLWGARTLPLDAAPDEAQSRLAVEFLLKHKRLAVFPQDEELVTFLHPYGTTRTTRPPLAFIASAAVTALVVGENDSLAIAFRYASSLFAALTVVVLFVLLLLYLRSVWLALLGSLLLGLLPQFAFMASYLSGDAAAVFAASMLLLSLVCVYRFGLNTSTAILTGASVGLVILSKFTAWIALPFAAVYVLSHVFIQFKNKWKLLPVMLAACIVAGGWWILFNMYHYGVTDPIQKNAVAVYYEKFADQEHLNALSYAARGIGFSDLLFDSSHGFMHATLIALVGNLDWLRLTLGLPQYNFYLVVIVLAILVAIVRLLQLPVSGFGWYQQFSSSAGKTFRKYSLEVLLLGVLLLQFWFYLWYNVKQDIQIQGKYLMPAVPALILLFCSGAASVGQWLRKTSDKNMWDWTERRLFSVWSLLGVASIAAVLLTHFSAFKYYVKPFYRQAAYFLTVAPGDSISLSDFKVAHVDKDIVFEPGENEWRISVSGNQYSMVFHPDVCKHIYKNTLVEMLIEADHVDEARLYIDDGKGFSKFRYGRGWYEPGTNMVAFAIGSEGCRRVLFQPKQRVGEIVIRSIKFSELKINPTNFPR